MRKETNNIEKDILDDVIDFVVNNLRCNKETRIHAAISVLRKKYGIMASYAVLEKRINHRLDDAGENK